MKQFSLSLCLCLFASALFAQIEFAPAGAAWSYHYTEAWTSDTGTLRIAYAGDTILEGRPCKKFCATKRSEILAPSPCDWPFAYLFTAQSNDSVFLSYGSNFLFSFKVKYNLGDSTQFPLLYSGRVFKVTEVSTVMYGNEAVNRYKLEHNSPIGGGLTTYIYDRFGPELTFFSNWWGISADWDDYSLCSYRDDTFPEVLFSGVGCSNIVSTHFPDSEHSGMALFPSPTEAFLQASFEDQQPSGMAQFTLFDSQGRLVRSGTVSGSRPVWDVHSLPSGVYLMAVQVDGQAFRQKFVKY